MSRAARWISWSVAGVLGVLVLLIIIVAVFDWNRLRPMVEERAAAALQRPVSIEGDLDVDWRWQDGLVPWPHITAQEVAIGHPEGFSGSGEHMARLDYLAVSVNPIPLLKRHVEIPLLEVGDSKISLQRNVEEQHNWVYQRRKDEEAGPAWTVDIQSIALRRVELQVMDDMRKLDMTTQFNSLEATDERGYGMDWESSGTFNDTEVSGSGQMGGILSLRESSEPFPMQGEVSFGETRIAVEGAMTAPKGLASLDVQFKLAGSSLADLNALFGLALPGTPPYSSEGRLVAMLEGEQDLWRYEDFTGKVGDSDLRGTLEYRVGGERPVLAGKVASDLLHFKDLGPLIGMDTSGGNAKDAKEAKTDKTAQENGADGAQGDAKDEGRSERKDAGKEEDERVQPKNKVLPVARIGSETWDLMDADVHFQGKRIVQKENLPLDNIEAHVLLQDRVLSFEPLNFGVAGGTLSNTLHIDGQGEVLQARMQTQARGLKLKQLFPGADSMDASFGELHGDAQLQGSGDSIASLLGSSNGEMSLALSRGTISRFLMEAAGLNVANVIFVKLFGDEQVMLECMVADFTVKDGLMQTRAFVIETEDAVVTMEGSISLKKETLNLDIHPQNKTLRIFTLRSPLYAKGTFRNPDVGVQAGPVAAKAGAAVVLGVVAAPLAALVPLLNVGTGDDQGCSSLGTKKKDKGEN